MPTAPRFANTHRRLIISNNCMKNNLFWIKNGNYVLVMTISTGTDPEAVT